MTRGQRWALAAAVLVGMAAGLGLFTFGYARGASYLTNDPAACSNCHIMNEHYAAWLKGSHHAVATCNDCHTPHDLVGKYAVKARNGFWHSFYFTVGGFPDPLRITEGNREVTEGACRYCHVEITQAIDHGVGTVSFAPERGDPPAVAPAVHAALADEPISCIRCHRYVGHWVR
ncbi:MAG TPA: cytochrome c nitrite reductase small subunit [Gemmatimonadaceae bacterium]